MHYFIARFFDGEAMPLTINAEFGTFTKDTSLEGCGAVSSSLTRRSPPAPSSLMENVELAKSMTDIQPKIATLESRCTSNSRKDSLRAATQASKDAIHDLKNITTVGYIDLFSNSSRLRIPSDSVSKGVRELRRWNYD